MPQHIPGIPGEGEFPPYAIRYVQTVPEEDVLAALESQISETLAVFAGVEPSRAAEYRYAPEKWTLNEVLGHMIDTERIFACRLLRIARGDTTPLPGFEQDDFVRGAAFNECATSDLIEEFRLVRQTTLHLLRKLPGEAWMRRGTVSGSPVTVRGLAYVTLGHERYHLRLVRERYL